MSYTANNPPLFDAMLDGAVVGMTSGQSASSSDPGYAEEVIRFDQIAVAAAAFAQAIDATIPPHEGGFSVSYCNLMEQICHAWWSGRYPLSNPAYADPSTYDSIILAIKAVFGDAQTYLQ